MNTIPGTGRSKSTIALILLFEKVKCLAEENLEAGSYRAEVQIAEENYSNPDTVRATLRLLNPYSIDIVVAELREKQKPWKFEREVVPNPRHVFHKELRKYLGTPEGEDVIFKVVRELDERVRWWEQLPDRKKQWQTKVDNYYSDLKVEKTQNGINATLQKLSDLLGTHLDQRIQYRFSRALVKMLERTDENWVGDQDEFVRSVFRDLNEVIFLDPTFAEAYCRRAEMQFALQNYDHARMDLEAALQLEPRHYWALKGMARIHKEAQEFENERIMLEKLQNLAPHEMVVAARLEELRRQKDDISANIPVD